MTEAADAGGNGPLPCSRPGESAPFEATKSGANPEGWARALRRSYNTAAGDYASWADNDPWNHLYDHPEVVALLPADLSGKVVLDLACGSGAYFADYLDRGAAVIGIDQSERLLGAVPSALKERVTLLCANLDEGLPLDQSADVDLAVVALAIHHLARPHSFFAELRRVLKSGAQVVLTTTHPTSDWLDRGGSYFDTGSDTYRWTTSQGEVRVPYWTAPLAEICDMFFRNGFLIEALREHRPSELIRQVDEQLYGRLDIRPGFIAFRLRLQDVDRSEP